MITVDTQLLVYAHVPGSESGVAREVLAHDTECAVPLLWRSEFRNVLLGYVRRQTLTVDEAQRAFDDAAALIAGREYTPSTPDILRLATTNRVTAYDHEYDSVAESLGVPLVTFDKEVLSAFPAIAIHPARFLSAS